MSQHRLPIHRDNLSFDERTDRMMRDVRRRMDEDLQRFGFGRHGLTSSLLSKGRMGDPWATTSLSAGGGEDDGFFPSHDFFQLRPSLGGRSGTSSPRRDEFGSRESLDDETTSKLYRSAGAGSGGEGTANGGDSRVFSMNFDVKDYSAEDISVTVEDETLIVQAKKRIEKDGAVSSKEFSRKIRIPPDVDPEKLSSTLTSDGILTVEAPAPPKYLPGSQSESEKQVSAAPLEKGIPLDKPIFSAPTNGSGGRRSMTLRLEVGKPYTPDDIVVKLEGRRLIVEAIHEEKAQGRTSRSSMQRDFELSEDIDLGTVQALLKDNGQLTITALV